MADPLAASFWKRHSRLFVMAAIPASIGAIVLLYFVTRPPAEISKSVNTLVVGALPVTCNLTGPIACMTMKMSAMDHAGMDMKGQDHAGMQMADPDYVTQDGQGKYVAKFVRY